MPTFLVSASVSTAVAIALGAFPSPASVPPRASNGFSDAGRVAAVSVRSYLPMTTRARERHVVVKGTVDCSDVLSPAGYAGSPLRLHLSSDGISKSVEYPRHMEVPGSGGVFGTPVYELYRFRTAVPPGKKAATVRWALSCQDRLGNLAGTSHGHFPLARSATRDICNHGGTIGIVLDVCNTALSAKLGKCGFAIVTAGTGSTLLDAASLALDPPKTWKQKLQAALEKVSSPLVGVVLACAPLLAPSSPPTSNTAPGTTGTASRGWPTGRDDVNIDVSVWLGSEFVLPDWMSCDPSYCIAGASGKVYVFALTHGIDQIAIIDESTADPAKALGALGIPASDVTALLAPKG